MLLPLSPLSQGKVTFIKLFPPFSLKEYKKAEAILKLSIDKVTHPNETQLELAKTYRKWGKSEKALAILEELNQSHPRSGVLAELGYCYFEGGRKKMARDIFEQLVKTDAVKGQFAIDWIIGKGDFELAEDIYFKVLEEYQDKLSVYRGLATLYGRWGKYDLARTYMRKRKP